MTSGEVKEPLKGIHAYYNTAMPRLIESIRTQRGAKNFSSGYSQLADAHRVLAMRAKYIDGNDEKFRQHLHVASKLDIESIRLKDYQRFQTARELLYALLSDSPEVIDALARLAPAYYVSARHNPLNYEFMAHMWQLATLGDYEALAAKVEKLSKNGRKPWRRDCADGKDFFSLLMRADKVGLESRITQDAKLPTDDSVISDFFTFRATFEAKLCWHKGIEVQIDSPRVPMDLMPVKPLAHYDDVYDFLKPGWVPPPQGLLGRVSQWFKR